MRTSASALSKQSVCALTFGWYHSSSQPAATASATPTGEVGGSSPDRSAPRLLRKLA